MTRLVTQGCVCPSQTCPGLSSFGLSGREIQAFSLTLAQIPPAAFDYRLGNRSALEWVIDQYQVSTDKRSGITSDPNREGDPEYIVRLIGQVIRVSLGAVKLVHDLLVEFEPKQFPRSVRGILLEVPPRVAALAVTKFMPLRVSA